MRAKALILFAASAALLISGAANAAEKNGRPLNPADPLASSAMKDNWRTRAMNAARGGAGRFDCGAASWYGACCR